MSTHLTRHANTTSPVGELTETAGPSVLGDALPILATPAAAVAAAAGVTAAGAAAVTGYVAEEAADG